MTDQTSEILLTEIRLLRDELRAFRDDVSSWKQESGERIKALEVSMKHGVDGNGQPSRLTVVEKRVDGLEKFRWIAAGVIAAVGAVFETVVHWLQK